ncbi:MAG: LysE family transporter [Muribaculaceae bacterium]|nr:LysE family transporter [Muribaculaceae bacterium]
MQIDSYIYLIPRAIAIGILVSAPMGPIGMLIIQRTLSKGRWPAFFTGIGAGISDLMYCLLTGFGLSFVTPFIEAHQFMIQLIGGIVLAAFGVYLFSKNPTRALQPTKHSSNNYWGDVVSGFLLTFSNPLILFFIIGLFARFNFILPEYEVHHFVIAYSLILAGALIWWYLVTFLVNKLRKRFNVRSLWIINRIIGLILLSMALVGVAMAIQTEFFPNLKIEIL